MKLLTLLSFAYSLLSLISSQSTVTLSPPNGTLSVCQGEVLTITCTCTVNGSQLLILGWLYGEGGVHFSSGDTVPKSIESFNFTLQCQNNVTLISTAVVNVNTSINGRTIQCRNTLPVDNSSITITQDINFSVKNSVPISYLHVNAVSSDTLLIIWTGADCIQSYDVFINGTNVNTTSGMSLLYNTGGAMGSIDVLVNSVDYYGSAVGNLSTQYQFNKYNFEVEAIISNNTSLVIIIKDKYINQQPVPLSCELTVTNLTQPSVDCLSKRLFIFTNVTEGDVYNYTVTITNVIGSAVMTGSIEIPYSPVVVCSSEVPNSPSTMIPISSASTPTGTVSSSCSDCALPWTVGILIGIVLAMIVISLLIIGILIYNKRKTKGN